MTYKDLAPTLMGHAHLRTKEHAILTLRYNRWYPSLYHKGYSVEEVENAKVLQVWAKPDFDFIVILDL